MNKLHLLLGALAITCTLATGARAEKTFDQPGDATHDCASDPVVRINAGGGTYTFTGACTELYLNGSSTKVTADAVDTVDVNGSMNTLTVNVVAKIKVNGTKNKITWTKAKTGKKPKVSSNGVGNAIAKAK